MYDFDTSPQTLSDEYGEYKIAEALLNDCQRGMGISFWLSGVNYRNAVVVGEQETDAAALSRLLQYRRQKLSEDAAV